MLYIVTEFVDGVNLADALGKEQPTAGRPGAAGCGGWRRGCASRTCWARSTATSRPTTCCWKMASWAARRSSTSASPRISIPAPRRSSATGFAGKLNYVAPEQLGDFGRDVGPWTDVYSLALVILAVAQGQERADGRQPGRCGRQASRRAGPFEAHPRLRSGRSSPRCWCPTRPSGCVRWMRCWKRSTPKIALVATRSGSSSQTPLGISAQGVAAAALALAKAYLRVHQRPEDAGDRPTRCRAARASSVNAIADPGRSRLHLAGHRQDREERATRSRGPLTGVAGNPDAAQSRDRPRR